MNIATATGTDLDAIGDSELTPRAPMEPDAAYRARILTVMRERAESGAPVTDESELEELRRKLSKAEALLAAIEASDDHAAVAVARLQWWRTWARGLTGAHDETNDELRRAIEGQIKSPGGPWRERVARLGDIRLEGLPDEMLWRLALEYVAAEPTAIIRALLAERLGVDQRGKSLGLLLELVARR